MRRIGLLLGISLIALTHVDVLSAQEVGQTADLTGCLAQEDEAGETEFMLENVGDSQAGEIELTAAEGVNLQPHVGHTVEVSGTVVSDDDEGAENDDGEAEMEDEADEAEEAEGMDEDGDLHIRVTKLTHLAASCSKD